MCIQHLTDFNTVVSRALTRNNKFVSDYDEIKIVLRGEKKKNRINYR